MALQSQRRTKSSKKRRASHFALKEKELSKCSKCGKPTKPHYVCAFCGYYKGRRVLKIKSKLDKKKKSTETAKED
ncbi:50S ribosomal protein L32 [Patescibacteria group bacterium]